MGRTRDGRTEQGETRESEDAQVVCFNLLRAALSGDLGGLLDDHLEEHLKGLCCAPHTIVLHVLHEMGVIEELTDDDRRRLRDFADLLILLHDALDASLRGVRRAWGAGV